MGKHGIIIHSKSIGNSSVFLRVRILDFKYIFDGQFGLERETLRVTADGSLAQTEHPFPDNALLDRDFCENQLELITPVCGSIGELIREISSLDKAARDALLKNGEYLWLNSNPPHINSEDDIPVANFAGARAVKKEYRLKLAKQYGKRLMLYSGIHFNFSFSEKFLKSVYDGNVSFNEFKNRLYFRLSKQVIRYSWLLVLLTAASPVYDLSLDGNGLSGSGFDGYSSRRSGDKGYWNKFIPLLDYSDLPSYIESIYDYVKSGRLFAPNELYLPVRLKPRGNNDLSAFAANGADHIELRMFDVNPLSPIGIFPEDLEFTHYFLIYLLSLPDFDFTCQMQEAAVKNHRLAALYDINNIFINGYPAMEAALGLLDDMRIFFDAAEADMRAEIMRNIDFERNKLINNDRYCVKVYEKFHNDFQNTMLEEIKKRV